MDGHHDYDEMMDR